MLVTNRRQNLRKTVSLRSEYIFFKLLGITATDNKFNESKSYTCSHINITRIILNIDQILSF